MYYRYCWLSFDKKHTIMITIFPSFPLIIVFIISVLQTQQIYAELDFNLLLHKFEFIGSWFYSWPGASLWDETLKKMWSGSREKVKWKEWKGKLSSWWAPKHNNGIIIFSERAGFEMRWLLWVWVYTDELTRTIRRTSTSSR